MLYNYINMNLHERMMDIYRQKIAMGGCNMGGYEDYDELLGHGGVYAGGVYAGGARTKGAKDKKTRKMSPKTTARTNFVNDYRHKHKMSYKEALVALTGKPTPAKYGKTTTKKKVAKKTGSKKTKSKTPAKKRVPYGYPINVPTSTQLRLLGITKKEFNDIASEDKLTARQRQRLGHRYADRDTLNRCINPDRTGEFFLDEEYECEPMKNFYKQKKKSPLKQKNIHPLEQIVVSPIQDMYINKVNIEPTEKETYHRMLQIRENIKILQEELTRLENMKILSMLPEIQV